MHLNTAEKVFPSILYNMTHLNTETHLKLFLSILVNRSVIGTFALASNQINTH